MGLQINFTIRKKDNGYQLIGSYKVGRNWKQKSKQGFVSFLLSARHTNSRRSVNKGTGTQGIQGKSRGRTGGNAGIC